ncbi:DUF4334 domain-containing protein [Nocardioides limicola]|uniref:DUF4334 domain-containing protein n=1 Tax=Nocardioides limicola TaxID=2803368 RepID=UPI00193AE531|nr:DUF4334 domain-containing protein [Nocardioides sp. DJM-14]
MTRLADLEPETSTEQAWELFDSLEPVSAAALTGRWRGRELRTGHPMDGLLEASGWFGKQFDGVDAVHPLLFQTPDGDIFAVDPRRLPLSVADRVPAGVVSRGRSMLGWVKPALATGKHRARLRDLEHRGVVTAAMVYDHLPIIDVFRRVDDDTVLGVMDQRGVPQPYFFILARD